MINSVTYFQMIYLRFNLQIFESCLCSMRPIQITVNFKQFTLLFIVCKILMLSFGSAKIAKRELRKTECNANNAEVVT
jgi:hypothetical protein